MLLGSAAMAQAPAFAQAAPTQSAPVQSAPAQSAPAQPASTAQPAAAPEVVRTIRSLNVTGNERLEADTVRSYIDLRAGETYDRVRLDRALKALFETELFADVQIRDDGDGNITIEVRENPVINRVLIEGGKRIKEDKIREEIKVAPRQIFTRSRARADVARILELYRRSGRFAAKVEPKIVQLEQNRVDLIFEISEGPKSKVRQINIIGNEQFSDKELRGEMATRQARPLRMFTSNDTYDPDRLAYDQQKLRQFYLTQGYADFRVVSSVAELTPDRRDFIVTYVVEEGERYKFGEVDLVSDIRDVKADQFKRLLPMKQGDWYNAKLVEDTIDGLTESVGLLGYAFADVRPNFDRDKDKREMNITFAVNETPRVYVESVTINGNTRTRDEVIRREFRLAEGDAFNSVKVKRSRDRIQSLGFFQDKLEVKQAPGAAPDKVALQVDVEERPTGSLQLSAGFSSIERFIFSFSIEERNFRGRAQQLRLSANVSSYSKSVEVGFTEPYLFDRNLAMGFDIFRRDYNSFSWNTNGERYTTYEQVTTGFQIRAGTAINEYWQAQIRYGLSVDKVDLHGDQYYTIDPETGVRECDPISAGHYLCDALGRYVTSSIGFSLVNDTLDNRMRPSRGQRLILNTDLAGLGGSVKYWRTRVNYDRYFRLPAGFVLNMGGEAGNIMGFGGDDVRLTDRFYLGEPRFRGFQIRGVGPRIIRKYRTLDDPETEAVEQDLNEDPDSWGSDSIGGRNYYLARAEVEIPLGSSGREMGIRPSVYVDVGALWSVKYPQLIDKPTTIVTTPIVDANGNPVLDDDGNPTFSTYTDYGFKEFAAGNSASPRVSVGIGVSWNSPFGPFRFDLAKVLRKVEGDETQVFQFNVGTQF
ncbi:outer membrane protein assembly factor BamA [Sandaracinobacter sp. RS1-74]|uniref:outer membrane protein assembly factor BamA n=1 Tax=Sandaracinobacteroides sayramensis TaxID=2913411 RepID=UPI001EDC5F8C|nr:outer membrane protein assembly factor BamA [Sandaracinobacteroides sayramensis]MCG2841648.1 outer membrane protein assembly factor BamA [Sandaracinobacteroides sayramensis]